MSGVTRRNAVDHDAPSWLDTMVHGKADRAYRTIADNTDELTGRCAARPSRGRVCVPPRGPWINAGDRHIGLVRRSITSQTSDRDVIPGLHIRRVVRIDPDRRSAAAAGSGNRNGWTNPPIHRAGCGEIGRDI